MILVLAFVCFAMCSCKKEEENNDVFYVEDVVFYPELTNVDYNYCGNLDDEIMAHVPIFASEETTSNTKTRDGISIQDSLEITSIEGSNVEKLKYIKSGDYWFFHATIDQNDYSYANVSILLSNESESNVKANINKINFECFDKEFSINVDIDIDYSDEYENYNTHLFQDSFASNNMNSTTFQSLIRDQNIKYFTSFKSDENFCDFSNGEKIIIKSIGLNSGNEMIKSLKYDIYAYKNDDNYGFEDYDFTKSFDYTISTEMNSFTFEVVIDIDKIEQCYSDNFIIEYKLETDKNYRKIVYPAFEYQCIKYENN